MNSGTPWDMLGQTVVVIGCGPGIGVASAQLLGQAGANVVCLDVDAAVVAQSAETLSANGIKCFHGVVDVLDRGNVRDVLAEISAAHGRIDGILNVVGRGTVGPIDRVSDSDFRAQLDINLNQHLTVAQEATSYLEQTSGAYVAVSSIRGLATAPDALGYGVAKAGLISMIRTLALEYGPRGIRFNAIAPGVVANSRTNVVWKLTAGSTTSPSSSTTSHSDDLPSHPMSAAGCFTCCHRWPDTSRGSFSSLTVERW